jgi:hypothetical protein
VSIVQRVFKKKILEILPNRHLGLLIGTTITTLRPELWIFQPSLVSILTVLMEKKNET